MEIISADNSAKSDWNEFVRRNYPPIGAFMQTWEWGEFQKSLGRKVERYLVQDAGRIVAAFTLVYHRTTGGFRYAYAPRGPVLAPEGEKRLGEVFAAIRQWALQNLPELVFARFEPPVESLGPRREGLVQPDYYVQPRFNLAVPLEPSPEEIAGGFHPSTRSNLARAERRGVTVEIKPEVTVSDYEEFSGMMRDTIQRNSGTNAYPDHAYFRGMFEAVPPAGPHHEPGVLSLGIFYGYQNGQPAGAHFVLFFGDTATYLYGASYTKHLNSKITTYLHWTALNEAKRRGMRFYDLGGIDESRWPSLTTFKRQFRGQEFAYAGNVDIPLRPVLYRLYNLARKIKK